MLKIPRIKIPKNINEVATTLSKFQNPGTILPVALIEATCVAGRSYQGYKRGGKDECRERLIEESICGSIWLGGVAMLNKVGDFIGEKFLKLKQIGTDVGKDALRDPFSNVEDAVKNKTAAFKFTKVALSVLITTGFMGFVLPKINQGITKKIKSKEKTPAQPVPSIVAPASAVSFNQFLNNVKTNQNNINFKGAGAMNGLLTATHNLEHNNIWRLLSTDTGITSGRVINSRNKYEAREYLFRDVASVYFYMFATSHVVNLLSKLSGNVKINSEALLKLQDHLEKKLEGKKLTVEEFENATLNKTISEEIIQKINFKDDVVKLNELKGILNEEQFEKATKMAALQPKIKGEALLSKMQVQDALAKNWLSEPELLDEVTQKATWGLSKDKNKFISKNKIEAARNSVDKFSEGVINYAKKKDIKEIDADLIQQLAKKNIKLSAAFTILGFASSIFGLSFLVPKVQQYLTFKATGKNAFPGTQNYE